MPELIYVHCKVTNPMSSIGQNCSITSGRCALMAVKHEGHHVSAVSSLASKRWRQLDATANFNNRHGILAGGHHPHLRGASASCRWCHLLSSQSSASLDALRHQWSRVARAAWTTFVQKKHSLGSDACRNIKNHVARALWLGVGTGCVPIDDVAVKDVPLEPHLHKMPNLLSRLAFVSALKTKCFEDFFCVVLSVMVPSYIHRIDTRE